jgi:peptide/nickel transport system substrate-binding protein
VATNLFSQLVKFVPGSSDIVPDAAESWDVSEDGKTWTFHLRRGVQFHKGYGELTSEDVKFSFERTLEPKTKSPNRSNLLAIDTIETPDAYTVVIKLKEPSAAILANLAYRSGWIVSKKAVEELGNAFSLNPIGSGPFEFQHWQPGGEVSLTAFQNYFEGAASIDELIFIPIVEDNIAQIALESGSIDLAYIRDGEILDQLRSNPEITVQSAPAPRWLALALNASKAPFDNADVRKAVAHALNKPQYVEALGGTGIVAETVLAPIVAGYNDKVATYEYDPAESRDLLEGAGLELPVKVDLLYTQIAPWPQLVPVLKAQLEDAGFEIALNGMEHGAWTSERQKGEYSMSVSSLTRPPNAEFMLRFGFHSSEVPPGFNLTFHSASDDLIEAASAELDEAKRVAMYQEIMSIIADEAAFLPLVFPTVDVAYGNYVKGHVAALSSDPVFYNVKITD